MTIDPAMLVWLNGNKNAKGPPNENYGREMMELFSLGAKRGYTEEDVRQMARTLTGWTSTTTAELGAHNFRFEKKRHDSASRRSSAGPDGGTGATDPALRRKREPSVLFRQQALELLRRRPALGQGPRDLIEIYVNSSWRIRPVVEAILMHPDFYEVRPDGQASDRPLAAMLRRAGAKIDTDAWISLCDRRDSSCSNRPTCPDGTTPAGSIPRDSRPDGTSSMRSTAPSMPRANPYTAVETPQEAVKRALHAWGNPPSAPKQGRTARFPAALGGVATNVSQQSEYRLMRQKGLQQLIGVGPTMVQYQ